MKGDILPCHINPETILIKFKKNESSTLIITDVGTTSGVNNNLFEEAFWSAPEIYHSFGSSELLLKSISSLCRCDIYSIGLIALYCIDNQRFLALKEKYNTKVSSEVLNNFFALLSLEFPAELCELLRKMVSYSPSDRPSFYKILKEIRNMTSILLKR